LSAENGLSALVPVLPGYRTPEFENQCTLSASPPYMTAKVRASIGMLVDRFADERRWTNLDEGRQTACSADARKPQKRPLRRPFGGRIPRRDCLTPHLFENAHKATNSLRIHNVKAHQSVPPVGDKTSLLQNPKVLRNSGPADRQSLGYIADGSRRMQRTPKNLPSRWIGKCSERLLTG
jgi:hypothetical protein